MKLLSWKKVKLSKSENMKYCKKEKKGVFSFLDKYELMTVQKAENFT